MNKEIIEIQLSHNQQTSAQLFALACAPETLCTIIAISPQKVVGPLYWGAMLNVLIVQDKSWYLLREANRSLLDSLLPLVAEHKRFFFIADKVNFIKELPLDDAADYLINVQPCLLTTHNLSKLKAVATPNTGEAIRLAQAMSMN